MHLCLITSWPLCVFKLSPVFPFVPKCPCSSCKWSCVFLCCWMTVSEFLGLDFCLFLFWLTCAVLPASVCLTCFLDLSFLFGFWPPLGSTLLCPFTVWAIILEFVSPPTSHSPHGGINNIITSLFSSITDMTVSATTYMTGFFLKKKQHNWEMLVISNVISNDDLFFCHFGSWFLRGDNVLDVWEANHTFFISFFAWSRKQMCEWERDRSKRAVVHGPKASLLKQVCPRKHTHKHECRLAHHSQTLGRRKWSHTGILCSLYLCNTVLPMCTVMLRRAFLKTRNYHVK